MLLTSYSFIFFFLILLLVYYAAPKTWQTGILVAASALFYLSASVSALAAVVVSGAVTHFVILPQMTGTREKKRRYAALAAGILLQTSLLLLMRYGGILHAGIVQPVGIAYYVLMAIGYLVDVYRGHIEPEQTYLRFQLFLMFFPLAPMGPISRYDHLSKSLFAPHPLDTAALCRGAERILYGFFKKLVIADRIRIAVDALIAGGGYDGAYVFVLMIFYTVCLYADFTGGIDIAIGCAQMLGIDVVENFDLPYGATSLAIFWNRWHISMGKWFTDYVFYPFSTSRFAGALMRLLKKAVSPRTAGRIVVACATLVTWCLTGLWHGAGAHFLVWGLMNGLILLLSRECTPLYRRAHARFSFLGGDVWKKISVVRTLFLVSALRLFDCYRSVPIAFARFFSALTFRRTGEVLNGGLLSLGLQTADYLVIIAGVIVMWLISRLHREGGARRWLALKPYPLRAALLFALFAATLLFGTYGPGYDAADFLYTRY